MQVPSHSIFHSQWDASFLAGRKRVSFCVVIPVTGPVLCTSARFLHTLSLALGTFVTQNIASVKSNFVSFPEKNAHNFFFIFQSKKHT